MKIISRVNSPTAVLSSKIFVSTGCYVCCVKCDIVHFPLAPRLAVPIQILAYPNSCISPPPRSQAFLCSWLSAVNMRQTRLAIFHNQSNVEHIYTYVSTTPLSRSSLWLTQTLQNRRTALPIQPPLVCVALLECDVAAVQSATLLTLAP